MSDAGIDKEKLQETLEQWDRDGYLHQAVQLLRVREVEVRKNIQAGIVAADGSVALSNFPDADWIKLYEAMSGLWAVAQLRPDVINLQGVPDRLHIIIASHIGRKWSEQDLDGQIDTAWGEIERDPTAQSTVALRADFVSKLGGVWFVYHNATGAKKPTPGPVAFLDGRHLRKT